MESSSKNTGVGSHFFLQRVFQTQGSDRASTLTSALSVAFKTFTTYGLLPSSLLHKFKNKRTAKPRYLYVRWANWSLERKASWLMTAPWTWTSLEPELVMWVLGSVWLLSFQWALPHPVPPAILVTQMVNGAAREGGVLELSRYLHDGYRGLLSPIW